MTNRKVLILGGAGFLGQNIAIRFNKEENNIVTIGDIFKPPDSKFDFWKINVFDKFLLDNTLNQYDVIINCTGQITNPINHCLKINTVGITNIANALRKFGNKLYHISTFAVYGTNDFVDEESELNPETPYATCKVFAEFQLNRIQDHKPCILRLPNLYGENQSKGLFAYLQKSFSTDKKLHFNNNGNLSRYFLHVSDCADSVFQAVNRNLSGIYNVPAPDKFSIKEIIEHIEKKFSIKYDTIFDPADPIENLKKISFNAFNKECGFAPTYNIVTFMNSTFFTR